MDKSICIVIGKNEHKMMNALKGHLNGIQIFDAMKTSGYPYYSGFIDCLFRMIKKRLIEASLSIEDLLEMRSLRYNKKNLKIWNKLATENTINLTERGKTLLIFFQL